MPCLLVADDIPLITSTIVRMVERERIPFRSVTEASNGIEAVEQARQIQPDIALIDIRMPGMDGLDAATIIRNEIPKTRIIFLTAYDEFAYVQRALQLGARDYLLKPVRPKQLTELLNKYLDEIKKEQAAQLSSGHRNFSSGYSSVSKNDPVKRAVAFIQQHFDRSDIALDEVAKAAHLSASHLAYLFKMKMGMSYKQYVTAQRLDAAKRLLHTTDWTIDVIAEHVGYPNATNFYRLFQRETGVTPAMYRNQKEETDNIVIL